MDAFASAAARSPTGSICVPLSIRVVIAAITSGATGSASTFLPLCCVKGDERVFAALGELVKELREEIAQGGVDAIRSSVVCHSDLRARLPHRAGRAAWQASGADVFAKGDEQAVDVDPVAERELALELGSGFFRRSGRDVAPAVGHPMNMDVHADPGLVARDSKREVRALRTDTREALQ